MTSPLAYEKVWFEKCRYDEAERSYFEKLAKLLLSNGLTALPVPKNATQSPHLLISEKQVSITNQTPIKKQSAVTTVSRETLTTSPLILSTHSQTEDEKRFKPKEVKEKRNKADKKGCDLNILKDDSKGSSNIPLKNSLAGEVAKVRQHIQNSLECMDGIAALATNVNVEIVNRLNTVERKNQELTSLVSDLQSVVKQLESRVKTLESQNNIKSSAPVTSKTAPAPTPSKAAKADDNDVDLFASDSDGESESVKKVKEEAAAAASKKKSKKQELIQKSIIILDVKPWDDETDMKEMEKNVRKINTDGLLWGASKLVPLAYGIHKLQISCVVEDEKVSIDWLQEAIEEIQDYVQSVDIAAFNKV
ncbi:hypothetical protein R5R35_000805 [Gryllus longicercus]|uniref:Translation elongation factor EF1B beta/delta subunit guanine nucleotide exchange domain-containing protein n=1 Tax=Gryllus longicercus TaxID=2509291 RepID=A0AAN9Z9E4_9ORTH